MWIRRYGYVKYYENEYWNKTFLLKKKKPVENNIKNAKIYQVEYLTDTFFMTLFLIFITFKFNHP